MRGVARGGCRLVGRAAPVSGRAAGSDRAGARLSRVAARLPGSALGCRRGPLEPAHPRRRLSTRKPSWWSCRAGRGLPVRHLRVARARAAFAASPRRRVGRGRPRRAGAGVRERASRRARQSPRARVRRRSALSGPCARRACPGRRAGAVLGADRSCRCPRRSACAGPPSPRAPTTRRCRRRVGRAVAAERTRPLGAAASYTDRRSGVGGHGRPTLIPCLEPTFLLRARPAQARARVGSAESSGSICELTATPSGGLPGPSQVPLRVALLPLAAELRAALRATAAVAA